jgi:hypothetical protein
VTVSDPTLGIAGFVVGVLGLGDSVVLTDGEISQLNVATRCVSSGEFLNTAVASGNSAESAQQVTDSDPAVLLCIGTPGIRIEKEISVDGGNTYFDADDPNADDVPLAPVGSGALYRFTVFNTGTVELLNVLVNDPTLGIDDFLVGSIPVGGSVVLTEGEIPDLNVALRCSTAGAFENVATASGQAADTGAQVSDSDPSNLICESCDIAVEKFCSVERPKKDDFVCKDAKPLTSLTLIWNGPSGVDVSTEAGESFNDVQNGDELSFQTGDDKDFEIWVSGAVDGESTFHLSCSDDDMNGPEDCGKAQGNGKGSSGLNLWLLEGIGGEGQSLDCSPEPVDPGDQAEQCEVEIADEACFDCKDAKPLTSLTLIWDGPSGVDVAAEGNQDFEDVQNGDEITFDVSGGGDFDLWVSGAVQGESTFHLSCSDDDMNGPEDCGKAQGDGKGKDDRLNLWLLEGIGGEGQSFNCSPGPGTDACGVPIPDNVNYSYRITNVGLPPVFIQSVVDDPLGNVPGAPSKALAPNESVELRLSAAITETTTNVVTVIGNTSSTGKGAVCDATDSVTVTVKKRPDFDTKDGDTKVGDTKDGDTKVDDTKDVDTKDGGSGTKDDEPWDFWSYYWRWLNSLYLGQ